MTNAKPPGVTPALDRDTLIDDFRSYVADPAFPCVGAKSALQRARIEYEVCDRLGSRASTDALCAGLARFALSHPDPGSDPVSFVVIFRDALGDEHSFHERLWQQLQAVHDRDIDHHPWAADVSDDPQAAAFSFSVASRAFFVVGLHPRSSRIARRSPRPTLVFNFHAQFEALRASGRFEKLQEAIRGRDLALQGTLNPALMRFGEASEALQYSGYAQGSCPFHSRAASH